MTTGNSMCQIVLNLYFTVLIIYLIQVIYMYQEFIIRTCTYVLLHIYYDLMVIICIASMYVIKE